MDEHLTPLDPALLGDAELVARAREGDRIAFGVLYLRHHAAAWRVACVVSAFSDDAEVALIEGFSTVFAALPSEFGEPAHSGRASLSFRPYLLACVRRAALDRTAKPGPAALTRGARLRRRPRAGATGPPSAPAPGGPDEVVLSGLEHHVVRSALGPLPERWRTALWLTEVEAMTPSEVAGIIGLDPPAATAVATRARDAVREACLRTHERSEVKAECRFAVDHLGAYLEGGLGRREQVLVRAHVEDCVACRMRRAELGNVTGSLLAAVSPPPLLGGECQRRWLATVGRATPPVGRGPLTPARAAARSRAARSRTAGLRWSASPALAVAVAALGAFLGVPRLIPTAPPIRQAQTALSSPVYRASLPEEPVPARGRAAAPPAATELVALVPAAESPAEAAPAVLAEPPAPPAAEPPAAPVAVPPLQVSLFPPPLPAPLPAPVDLPEPPPLPQLPVVDRPGKGHGEAKGHQRKEAPAVTLVAASLESPPLGKGNKGHGHGKKGTLA